ncbi:Hypothetical protein NTJ_04926 [Nesidiocoris tenuis]|uniref:Uncharacterized protein n=1 Tax=Nesidiocoris tenuis TaxID=355587 RepID=A0ABN7AMI7_9HEMI|nr:Hypothetical protein NTJ_04926 [Nesidiocoris tenuis]
MEYLGGMSRRKPHNSGAQSIDSWGEYCRHKFEQSTHLFDCFESERGPADLNNRVPAGGFPNIGRPYYAQGLASPYT